MLGKHPWYAAGLCEPKRLSAFGAVSRGPAATTRTRRVLIVTTFAAHRNRTDPARLSEGSRFPPRRERILRRERRRSLELCHRITGCLSDRVHAGRLTHVTVSRLVHLNVPTLSQWVIHRRERPRSAALL
jgi:hypothetical protein